MLSERADEAEMTGCLKGSNPITVGAFKLWQLGNSYQILREIDILVLHFIHPPVA